MKNTTTSLPQGFIEVLPDLTVNDQFDAKFMKVLEEVEQRPDNAEARTARDSGKNWHWIYAGEMTRNEALKKLELLGEGWALPSPSDTTVGALNGIKFQGPNLVDNSESGYDLRKDLPHMSFRHRAAIVDLFGFGMTTDVTDKTKCRVYFVKK